MLMLMKHTGERLRTHSTKSEKKVKKLKREVEHPRASAEMPLPNQIEHAEFSKEQRVASREQSVCQLSNQLFFC